MRVCCPGGSMSARLNFRAIKKSELWLVRDVNGILCAFIAEALIGYAGVISVCVLVDAVFAHSQWKKVAATSSYVLLSLLAMYTHMKCMLSNPGTVPSSVVSRKERKNGLQPLAPCENTGSTPICSICFAYKHLHTHHCKICGHCIQKMDHHCPWVNNCVGAQNTKTFLLFLVYIFALASAALSLVAMGMAACMADIDDDVCQAVSIHIGHVAVLIIEALLFGLFCLVTFIDMLRGIKANSTGIDRLQNTRGEARAFCQGMTEVCGEPFNYRWLLPCNPSQPRWTSGSVKATHLPLQTV